MSRLSPWQVADALHRIVDDAADNGLHYDELLSIAYAWLIINKLHGITGWSSTHEGIGDAFPHYLFDQFQEWHSVFRALSYVILRAR